MTFWDLFGWIAFVLNVWGNLALTTKGTRGWIIRIGSNLAWMPYGVYTRAWALSANHFLFMAINAYGWWKWKHDDKLSVSKSFESRLCVALGWAPDRNPEEALTCVRQMVLNAAEFER